MRYTRNQTKALYLIKHINPINLQDLTKGKAKTPFIIAVSINGQAVFYCEYCKKSHRHGLGNGYRHPHCFKEGYHDFNSDYYIVCFEPEEIIELLNPVSYSSKTLETSLDTKKRQIKQINTN